MLKFDPDERITAAEALMHPYLEEYHEYIEEEYCDIDRVFVQDFEEPSLKEEDLKTLIFEEIKSFHSDIYNDEKVLSMYDSAYVKNKKRKKISAKVNVTEQEIKSYNESKNHSSYMSSSQYSVASMMNLSSFNQSGQQQMNITSSNN